MITLLPGEGHPGDPIQQRIAAMNAAITEINDEIIAKLGRGVATLLNGTTSIVVTHSLGWTPAPGDVVVCPLETLAAASFFWVDTFTATQFTIHVNADPTADVDFAWQAQQVD